MPVQASRFLRLADFSDAVRPASRGNLILRGLRFAVALMALGVLPLLPGCNTYNPYLGASPTVSSSITSITPAGEPAGHAGILITVNGSGFVAGSNVTWNSSNSTSTNLVSNFVSSTEMQASIPDNFLASPGTFFVGVIAPGPTSGNNAGNGISNFVQFMVCPASGCSSGVSIQKARVSSPPPVTSSPASSPIQTSGRYQTFVADSADGSIEGAGGFARIFLRDSCLGAPVACAPQMLAISVGWNGSDPNGPSNSPSATNDGRFVVFASEANNLVKGDGNGSSDVFLRDTCIGAASVCVPGTIRLSIGPDGAEANRPSFSPAVSRDGRFVLFNSGATNLVRPDSLNALPPFSTPPSFLRDTCFGADSACIPRTSRVVSASALQH